MQKLSSLAIFSCVLILSACSTYNRVVDEIKYSDWMGGGGPSSSKSENFLSDGCPQAGVVPELGTFSEFTDNSQPSGPTLVSYARIASVQSKCTYSSQSVTVDIRLAFEGKLGPQGGVMSKPYFSYPFFIAVTSPGGSILAKEVFAANMTYQPGQDQNTYFESMRQIIPIPNKSAGAQFKVLAGFQLTPEQLGYNRAVIAADEAARKQREEIEKKAVETARKNAKTGEAEVIVVPDTTAPGAEMQPVDQQPLAPVNLVPLQ